MANSNKAIAKQDLKDFAQGLIMQFNEEINWKLKSIGLEKPGLNHQYIHRSSVLEKILKAKELVVEGNNIDRVTYLLDEAVEDIKERNKKLLVAESIAGDRAVVKSLFINHSLIAMNCH